MKRPLRNIGNRVKVKLEKERAENEALTEAHLNDCKKLISSVFGKLGDSALASALAEQSLSRSLLETMRLASATARQNVEDFPRVEISFNEYSRGEIRSRSRQLRDMSYSQAFDSIEQSFDDGVRGARLRGDREATFSVRDQLNVGDIIACDLFPILHERLNPETCSLFSGLGRTIMCHQRERSYIKTFLIPMVVKRVLQGRPGVRAVICGVCERSAWARHGLPEVGILHHRFIGLRIPVLAVPDDPDWQSPQATKALLSNQPLAIESMFAGVPVIKISHLIK